MSKVKCNIKSIIGELSDIDSRNEKKVVALVSWNDRPETIDIRRYNINDKFLLKGISLSRDETELLLYTLLTTDEITYDVQKVIDLAKNKIPPKGINIEELIDNMETEENNDGNYKRTSNGFIKIL